MLALDSNPALNASFDCSTDDNTQTLSKDSTVSQTQYIPKDLTSTVNKPEVNKLGALDDSVQAPENNDKILKDYIGDFF